jgi:hypothetical protein
LGELGYSPNIGKSSSDNRKQEENAYLIQSYVYLKNYFILNSSNVKWGGILTYTYQFDGESETTSTTGNVSTTSYSGAASLAVAGFAEFEKLANWHLMAEYRRYGVGTTTSSSGAVLDTVEYGIVTFLSSLKFNVTPAFSLVPEVSYSTLPDKNIGSFYQFDTYNVYSIGLGMRLLF